ncbi:MAG: nicotinamide mononucleotide transporter [Patescibacteria group bacterium]|nr:nicotinamide mononucleotide transporter [Patescibacteria group bacterium]
MWDNISQAVIFVFGVLSIFLVAKKNKWGFVCGLLTQPFWFITTFINHQWPIFFLNFLYTATWIFGVYEWFYKDKKIINKP